MNVSRSIFPNNAETTRYLPKNWANIVFKSRQGPMALETKRAPEFRGNQQGSLPFAQAVAVVESKQRERSTVIFRQPAITNLGIAINPLQPEEAPLNRASHRCIRMFQLPLYVHAFDERLTKFASKGSSSKTPLAKPNEAKMFRSVFLYNARKWCFSPVI